MEDRHVVARVGDALLIAVLDGHGGAAVAERAATMLPGAVRSRLRAKATPRAALVEAIAELDAALQAPDTGTTLTAAVLQGRRLTIAQLGDSRLVLVTPRGARTLTRDHRLSVASERRRVLAAGAAIDGAYVVRGAQGLMVTRALGDRWFRPVGVIGTPDVTELVLPADVRALITATDGLWDVLTPAAAGRLTARAPSVQQAADALVAAALEADTRDNVTVLVLLAGRHSSLHG
jgi:serine/threonine protein phosphatase PrpC